MRYRDLRPDEFAPLAEMMAEAFHRKPDGWEERMRALGHETSRVVERDGHLLAALKLVPLAQWLNGRAVENTWISGLGVRPEARGGGTGRFLLSQTLRELHGQGVPISGLYGTTQTFYRRLGWECAGSRYVVETPIRYLNARPGPLEIRKLGDGDHALAEALHLRHARGQGSLRRTDYCWRRLRSPQHQSTVGHGFFRGSELRGYTYRLDDEGDLSGVKLHFTDVLLVDADATRAFLAFLAGYRALGVSASWATTNPSPALLALSDPWQVRLSLADHWMLRIVHLPRALQTFSYRGQGQLHLEILDDVLPENSGAWRLTVADGEGVLERGGRGSCRLDIRGLACLYTGFADSHTVAALGYLRAEEKERATLDSLFSSARPPQLTDIL